MLHHPFQIARWALLVSFAVMVFVVAFPNPLPSSAWKLAEKNRYEKRFPALRKPPEPASEPATQLADGKQKSPNASKRIAPETSEKPLRTAHLPSRLASDDDQPRGVRIQEPIFFLEEEKPTVGNLAPDPAHLETPSRTPER